MWNTNSMTVHSHDEEDESWEVKAFAQDTENAMGTTWPPRSYTCTFCRREFRSAQALGGHMNVHRRDRARLHQAQPIFRNPNLSSSSTQELVPDTTAGMCLLFALPKPNPSFKPSSSLSNVNGGTSSHLHSNTGNFMNFPAVVAPHTPNFPAVVDSNSNQRFSLEDTIKKTDLAVDGVDLELRLGCSSSSSSS